MSGSRRTGSGLRLPQFYLFVLLTIGLDQLTKWLALDLLSSFETVPVIPGFFHFTLVKNRGIAFGLFHAYPGLILGLITLSLIFLFCYGYKIARLPASGERSWKRGLPTAAIALILGGAAGNWIDRLRFGAVIDFLDFRIWPVFNAADTAISIGVGLYFISLFFGTASSKDRECE